MDNLEQRVMKIVAEQLGANEADVKMESSFVNDLGADSLDTVELVKSSNLRGRGGAGFPCGLKWSFLPKDHPGPIYMCVNADESEPATFNNRILMELDPHQVIEGIMIGCYATRAQTAYIYVRYEYPTAFRRLGQFLVAPRPPGSGTFSGTPEVRVSFF